MQPAFLSNNSLPVALFCLVRLLADNVSWWGISSDGVPAALAVADGRDANFDAVLPHALSWGGD